ncbi:MAG TPA: hypothetical protein VFQ35_05180 [Polyangiaceae bacterium]|nr:hypothetical protein [Polyangiaceae bacterium]
MRELAFAVIALQALFMLVDEARFHRRRGLPRWERIGHPIDTASVLACCCVTVVFEPTPRSLWLYAALGIGSCLLVTKDEFVHSRHCEPMEHWLHAMLFILHPLLLAALAVLWLQHERVVLTAQTLATFAFGAYQAIYWNAIASPVHRRPSRARVVHQGSE